MDPGAHLGAGRFGKFQFWGSDTLKGCGFGSIDLSERFFCYDKCMLMEEIRG